MIRKSLAVLTAAVCLLGIPGMAFAAQVDCDSVYCFGQSDFSPEETISGICITALPESSAGTLFLGTRVLQPGDILTAGQLEQMTFVPLRRESDLSARLEYLPIYSDRVEACSVMTLSIRGKEDKAPVAEDDALETYKNLELQGKLKVQDPEGQAMTYTVTRQPRRGSITIHEDDSFTYSPKKNKVGVDSFVYTAADPAGKVSREATVTITILKPTDAPQYTDTVGHSCRFAAEWMKHTGIFQGENVVGNPCFNPEKQVSRGEFVTMLVKTLDLPAEEPSLYTGYTDEIPVWLKPYLAAAVRSGLTAGLPDQQTFGADTVITGEEAAVMLHNALDLAVESAAAGEESSYSQTALQTLQRHGFPLEEGALTRSQAADTLYLVHRMNSRGLGIFTE